MAGQCYPILISTNLQDLAMGPLNYMRCPVASDRVYVVIPYWAGSGRPMTI